MLACSTSVVHEFHLGGTPRCTRQLQEAPPRMKALKRRAPLCQGGCQVDGRVEWDACSWHGILQELQAWASVLNTDGAPGGNCAGLGNSLEA